VQSEIETAFQKDSSLASDGLSVKVTDNKVELSGEVANDGEKERARSIAEAKAGGRQVENRIRIKVKGGSEAPPKY
jgi:osmotically-inducible protein OsmY